MMNAASTSNPSVTVNVGEAYPYPSHAIGPNFVTMKLSGKDTYSVWETQILSLLWSQHMVGFIEDQFPSPEGNGKGKVGDIDAWIASDSLVKGWILGSLSDEVAKKVVNRLKTIHKNTYFTAKDLWDQLQRSYGPSNCKQAADSLVKGWILGSLSEEARKAVNHLIHMEKDPDFTAKDLWDELQRSYGPSVREQAVETKSPTRQAESEIEEISESEDAKSKEKPTEEKTEEEKRAEIFQKEFETKLPTRQAESEIEGMLVSEDAKSKDESLDPLDKSIQEIEKRLLYDCIIKGDTKYAIDILKRERLKPWEKLTNNGNTILHVAVGSSTKNHELLEKFLEMTPKENTSNNLKNSNGSTLLHVAANSIGGNIEAIKMLVKRNPELLLAKDKEGHIPLALSISNMHTMISNCLYWQIIAHGYANLFSGQSGEDLVVLAISCQDFRLANMIINDYRDAILSDSDVVLMALAQNFPRELNFWERRDFRTDINRYTCRFQRADEYNNACWTVLSSMLSLFLVYSLIG